MLFYVEIIDKGFQKYSNESANLVKVPWECLAVAYYMFFYVSNRQLKPISISLFIKSLQKYNQFNELLLIKIKYFQKYANFS